MMPGTIVAYSAGPARLARVIELQGMRARLAPLTGGRPFWRDVATLWPLLDRMP